MLSNTIHELDTDKYEIIQQRKKKIHDLNIQLSLLQNIKINDLIYDIQRESTIMQLKSRISKLEIFNEPKLITDNNDNIADVSDIHITEKQ
jgi:hypothetical protein